jgi:hypothetical protein
MHVGGELMEIDNAFLSMGLTVVGLIAGFTYFSTNQRNFQMQQEEKRRESLSEMNEKIVRLETQMEIFLKGVGAQVPGILMKGNPISVDSRLYTLMERFTSRTIQPNERCELILELEHESRNDEHTAGERISMSIWAASQRALMPEELERKCRDGFTLTDRT